MVKPHNGLKQTKYLAVGPLEEISKISQDLQGRTHYENASEINSNKKFVT